MRLQRSCSILFISVFMFEIAGRQSLPAQSASPPSPQANTLAQKPGAVTISLDEAIRLALQHNHNVLAARTVIQQNEAEETTANLRPNPVLLGDSQFLPIFQPSQFSADYLDNSAQFDLGVSYLFERGKKRQHRLQAAKDVTAVSRSQVADNERTLAFSVASQFINVELAESTLELATKDLKSFQDTVNIGEARYKAGDVGLDDLLKLKLQMLQFQTDVSAAELSRVQGLSDLRQLLGYESIDADYDVAGSFDYQPVARKSRRLSNKGTSKQAGLACGTVRGQCSEQPACTATIYRQARCDGANQLHPPQLHQQCLSVRANSASHFRSQPGGDCACRPRHHASTGTGEIRERTGADRREGCFRERSLER